MPNIYHHHLLLCVVSSLALAFAYPAAAEENSTTTDVHKVNLMEWVQAGQTTNIPQTFILDHHNTLFSRLQFGDETKFLAALKQGTQQDTQANLVPVLQNKFPAVWQHISEKLTQHPKVLLTVGIDPEVAHCKPCSMQQQILQQHQNFDMPVVKLVLSK